MAIIGRAAFNGPIFQKIQLKALEGLWGKGYNIDGLSDPITRLQYVSLWKEPVCSRGKTAFDMR